MNILLISSGDYFSTYGGGQVYVRRLTHELCRKKGVNLTVLSFSSKTHIGEINECNDNNVPIYQLNLKEKESFIEKIINRLAPNLIHAHGNKSQIAIICHRLGIPCIVTAHHGGLLCPAGSLLNNKEKICSCQVSHYNCLPCVLQNIRTGSYLYPCMKLLPEKYYLSIGKFLKRLPFIPLLSPIGESALAIAETKEKWNSILNHATLLISPSQAMATAMIRNGLSEEKIKVIPHGVPDDVIVPQKTSPDGSFHFFYIGRMSRIKGVHILLTAFQRLQQPKVFLHLIGDAGNKQERLYLEKLKKRYTKSKQIIWHGKVKADSIPTMIRNWHVMVMPTICLEAYGLTISEALIQGKPVLATRCGGAEMQIIEGHNGWLVPPNSVEALHTTMTQILKKPNLPMDVAVTNQTQHVQQLIDIYEKITH